ncbi:hypothetical protein HBA55_03475 [Pseudomaricurvus alkylphenolicus]|uniref:hypothetical protein n=1 Tax=Pseudomaricurvus alkylphenolicus TaxID=1306991 RepID=UPI001422CE0D|nr:hypothetical protein [Pseudomaricurvus alkylphenolicus]NIB38629.1 hypothetical protein [Pseudomaricurvus alkylphenolicus]
MLRAAFLIALSIVPLFTQSSELPLTVEDLLTANDRYRVDLDVNYFNDSTDEQLLAQKSNLDLVTVNMGLRYGLTLGTELSLQSSWQHMQARYQQGTHLSQMSDSHMSKWTLGATHRFAADNGKHPALLAFADAHYHQREDSGDNSWSWVYGITAYRSLDPILLSASLSIGSHQPYRVANLRVTPGDSVTLVPTVSFAVNPWITLSGGLRWSWIEGHQLDGEEASINATKSELILGLGYHWSQDLSIRVSTDFALSEDSGSTLRLNLTYKFDESL